MTVTNINSANFAETVLNSSKPVLVDFWAKWCGPCRMLAPELEALAAEHPEIAFAKVDVDEFPALADKFGISAIPALIFFKNGEPAASSVGYRSRSELEELIK